MREVCSRCGNYVFRVEPTGRACVTCGAFTFDGDCTTDDCWEQFQVNSQFFQIDDWPHSDIPVARSWHIISELDVMFEKSFEAYSRPVGLEPEDVR